MVLVTRSFKYKTLRGGFINIFVIIYSPFNEQTTKESEESRRESGFIASVVTSRAWGTTENTQARRPPDQSTLPSTAKFKTGVFVVRLEV